MLQAELRGKLGDHSRHEDVLTSSAFGTLLLAGDAGVSLLRAWLSHARLASDWARLHVPDCAPTEFGAWFWPSLPPNVEPDVVFRFGRLLIVVEAKYRSPSSDIDRLGADGALSRSEGPGAVIERQLVRQWTACQPESANDAGVASNLREALRATDERVVVYLVDADDARSAERTVGASLRDQPSARIGVLYWQSLYALLVKSLRETADGPCGQWRSELAELLRQRELATFAGFRHVLQRCGSELPMALGALYLERASLRAAVRHLAGDAHRLQLAWQRLSDRHVVRERGPS